MVSWGMQGAFQFFGMCQCSLCCKILRSALAQMRLSLLKVSSGAQVPIMWDITADRHPVSLKLPSAKPAAYARRTFISEENRSNLFWQRVGLARYPTHFGLLIRPSRRLFKPKHRPDQIHYFNTAQAQSLTETCTCWIYALGSL